MMAVTYPRNYEGHRKQNLHGAVRLIYKVLSWSASHSFSFSFYAFLAFVRIVFFCFSPFATGEYKSHSLEISNLSDLPAIAIAHVVSKVCAVERRVR